jgi:hypothetical protein
MTAAIEPPSESSTDDGALLRALLDIVWWGAYGEARLGTVGTHGVAPCIRIGEHTYMVDGNDDRRRLIEYAERLRNREPNAPIEALP